MTIWEIVILVLAVAFALAVLQMNHYFWRDWHTRKDHEYRLCGMDREFALRKTEQERGQEHEFARMEKQLEFERQRRALEEKTPQPGGYH